MALCELHYFSKALAMQTAANVLLPETDITGPLPVFYLLHGLSDDHTIWTRRTSIERYLTNLPLIVVMPNGGRGFYTDAHVGLRYEAALLELIDYIDHRFHTNATREGRCIGGLSMGGYGAAKMALKFPQLFVSANSHSGAMRFSHRAPSSRAQEFLRITGPKPAGGPNDLFALARNLKKSPQQPALRLDCGQGDFLLPDNRLFHQHLDKLDIAHEYQEFPGSHNWAYWDTHVQEALAFHVGHLGIG